MKTLFLFSLMISSLYLQQATYCMDGSKTALVKEASPKDSYQNEKSHTLPQQKSTHLLSHKQASDSYQSLADAESEPEPSKKSLWQIIKQKLSFKKSDESSSSYQVPDKVMPLIFQPR